MFGLAILFGFGVWIALTVIAVKFGVKIGKYFFPNKGSAIGGFIGFMLLMGGFIVSWIYEYIAIQNKVTHLCETEAGLTVYVTPEEWRKQIGEDEWRTLYPDWKNISSDLTFTFKGKVYHGASRENRRVYTYEITDNNQDGIGDYDMIYVDIKTKQVLFHERAFGVGVPPVGVSLEGLKFWRNYIKDCRWGEWSPYDRFFNDEYSNREVKKGE